MGYMTGVTVKGLKLVTKVTELLNQLTASDFEDTYVNLRVSICEPEGGDELGFWSNEYDFGNWAYFDTTRGTKVKKASESLSVEELAKVIDSERPNNRPADVSDSRNQAFAVMSLLKEKGML